jgi:hypothetical protein
MAKKDLIIGAFRGYTYNQVKPWIDSINECGFIGDKVLIALGTTPETINKIAQAGFIVIDGGNEPPRMMFHMERFVHINRFLNDNYRNYRYVITTDVRDVIFQKNPIEYLESILNDDLSLDVVASSESILIKNEPWNRDNIIKCFGQMYYEQICNNEVLNVGTLAGRAGSIKDLTAAIFQMSFNRADWVADQAAYNIMMGWRQYYRTTHIAILEHAWACNLHVTNKPDQMNQFGPYLLEKRPTFENGLVVNRNKTPFCIVHQYDRVPEMKNYYEEKYGVKDVITFRTDNV